MNRAMWFIIPVLILLAQDVRAGDKSQTVRAPASIKSKVAKKSMEKKAHDHYVHEMFHQAVEAPVKIKEAGL